MSTEAEPQGDATPEPQGDEKKNPPQGEQQPPQGDADGTDWKAEARKWEKAAKKDAAEKAKAEQQLQAIKDVASGKDAQATEAEKRAARAELEAVKFRVAYEAGLPPDLAERLKGDSEEELKADAEALVKYAKAARKPKSDAGADDGAKGGGKQDANTLLRQWAGG